MFRPAVEASGICLFKYPDKIEASIFHTFWKCHCPGDMCLVPAACRAQQGRCSCCLRAHVGADRRTELLGWVCSVRAGMEGFLQTHFDWQSLWRISGLKERICIWTSECCCEQRSACRCLVCPYALWEKFGAFRKDCVVTQRVQWKREGTCNKKEVYGACPPFLDLHFCHFPSLRKRTFPCLPTSIEDSCVGLPHWDHELMWSAWSSMWRTFPLWFTQTK